MRRVVLVLAFFALTALFFKMPETPQLFGFCQACSGSDPWLPLLGAAYFALLLAIGFFFPQFPGRWTARGGFIGAVLLAWMLLSSELCVPCLAAHGCNIAIWLIWCFQTRRISRETATKEKLCFCLFAPLLAVTLFSCLNLMLMVYSVKNPVSIGLQPGELAPVFAFPVSDGPVTDRVVISFIAPDCPHCKKQMEVMEAVARELQGGAYRFIYVTPFLPAQKSGGIEWVEDRDGFFRELFKVAGTPTLIVVGADRRVVLSIPGVPEALKAYLLASLM